MKRRTAWVLAAGVAAVALGAAAVGAVAAAWCAGGRSSGRLVGRRQYLAARVAGELPEEPATGLSGTLREPAAVAAGAGRGDRPGRERTRRWRGCCCAWDGSTPAGRRAQELRDALVRFRRSGKPSWAHLEIAGNLEYYLATGCAKIAASPTALARRARASPPRSPSSRGTLDKLGVEAQFEGVGKYKNAPNQFTETSFTEPHREQMEALVGVALRRVRRGPSPRGAGLEEAP